MYHVPAHKNILHPAGQIIMNQNDLREAIREQEKLNRSVAYNCKWALGTLCVILLLILL